MTEYTCENCGDEITEGEVAYDNMGWCAGCLEVAEREMDIIDAAEFDTMYAQRAWDDDLDRQARTAPNGYVYWPAPPF